jgi:class 3 adenylate cyclase
MDRLARAARGRSAGTAAAGLARAARGRDDRRGDVRLPSGTVTFLFTDVEGSTRLLREEAEALAAG